MDLILQAIALGILQGLAEFLPISSSAHLIVVPEWLGWDNPFLNSNAFDVMLHIGTLIALVVYFWADLWRYFRAWILSLLERRIGSDPDRRLAWLLLVTVIPGALLGVAGESFFDTFFREHSQYIAFTMVVGAAALWVGEARGSRLRILEGLRLPDAFAIGVAQALALFPGISRSGITIAVGLMAGLEREAAARFSFLMAAPIIAGAGIWKSRELLAGGAGAANLGPLVAGTIAAAVAGLVAVAFLLNWLRRRSTGIFICYRVLFAAAMVVVLLAR